MLGASNYQKLEFPRSFPILAEAIDDVVESLTAYLDDDSETYPKTLTNAGVPYLPQEVKDAQCEQALYLLKVGDAADRREQLRAQGVKAFRIGEFSETYESGQLIYVSHKVTQILRKFIRSGFSIKRC